MAYQENFFDKLESNNKQVVEGAKQSLREQFNKVSEPWLLNGLYEYYLSTNSIRCMEILTTLREPHHQYLFERLFESLRSQKVELRVQALTLLGHIARSQPSWLYKLPHHVVFKELLKLLQREEELLPLISALLVLIVLLPMIPSSVGSHLDDIFDIFLRLAAWNSIPGKLAEDQMIHLQVALYALFLRLYGMFPCNFINYLRTMHLRHKNRPVFLHTIKPMLDTVKMHASLVTASREHETTTERWVKMDVHDVIIECERFSLDTTDRCPHDTCQNASGFRSRSGTTNSTVESSFQLQNIKSLTSIHALGNENAFFTPTQVFHVQTPPITEATPSTVQGFSQASDYNMEGTSPPEAAIEATPETTPIRDFRTTPALSHHSSLLPSSSAARALTSFRTSAGSFSLASPSHSQPSSPMKKEPPTSVFSYPNDHQQESNNRPSSSGRASAFSRPTAAISGTTTAMVHSGSQKRARELVLERQQIASTEPHPTQSKSKPPPSSPLRIINPSDLANRQPSQSYQRDDSPVSQEDEEVSSIVSKRTPQKRPAARPCDSVLPEFDNLGDPNGNDQEHGSPCTEGGLHMPNSKSMTNFKKRIRRYRYHSQCNPEPEKIEMSTGSSPGKAGTSFSGSTSVVRRANSCPEMEKTPRGPSLKDSNKRRPVYETDEETVSEDQVESLSGTSNGLDERRKIPKITSTTQTDNFWPMPYEHLFFLVFPALEATDVKPSPAPSPAPFNLSQQPEKIQPSLYDVLDRYVEKAIVTADSKGLSDQLQLLHQQLLFERHRRETHAYRNRRLLSDARNTRLLEECNSALKDQVQLKQRDIEDCRMQLENYRAKDLEEKETLHNTIHYWEERFNLLQDETNALKQANYQLEKDNAQYREQNNKLERERQDALAELTNAIAEISVVREQAQSADRVRADLNHANRELLLMGEVLNKYKEALGKPAAKKQMAEEMAQLNSAYKHEITTLRNQLEAKQAQTDAYKHRIADLEQMLLSREENVLSNKRAVAAAHQEREALIEAVESKYQTQKRINQTLEMRCVELMQRLEAEIGNKRNANSPDTSSCHEVQVATTPSPLSASLASSAGSSVPLGDVRNLQTLVDQPELNVISSRTAGPFQGFVDETGKHPGGMEPSTSSKK